MIFKANRHTLFIRKINTEWAPWFIPGYCFLVKSEISVMKIYQTILDNLGSSINILITFGWNQSARQLHCSVVPSTSTWLGFWCNSWVIALLGAEKLAWSKSEFVVQKSRTTKDIWKNHSGSYICFNNQMEWLLLEFWNWEIKELGVILLSFSWDNLRLAG